MSGFSSLFSSPALRRRISLGYAVRQRLQSDHHLPVWGAPVELQKHVQTEAVAGQMAGGGGQRHRLAQLHRQNLPAGPETEKAHQHRGDGQGVAGAALYAPPEAHGAGDYRAGRPAAAGEGSGACMVLQSEAEGKKWVNVRILCFLLRSYRSIVL